MPDTIFVQYPTSLSCAETIFGCLLETLSKFLHTSQRTNMEMIYLFIYENKRWKALLVPHVAI
jgi:hypothetical protein